MPSLPLIRLVQFYSGYLCQQRLLLTAQLGAANLAGVMPRTAGTQESSFLNESDNEWQRVLAINVGGMRNCMRAELRHFHPDGCSIVNASSLTGQMASPNNSLYAMSKAAVISLTLSVAHEFGRKGVRINAIAP